MGLKKIVMLTFWVGFVAGCTPLHPSDCHKTTATGSCSSGRWDDQDEWGAQARGIRAAINAKLDEPHNWKGKKISNLKLDVNCFSITVSPDNRTLWGIANNPDPELVYFELPAID